ncbi:Vegetative incompatibility protein [Paramyrothecium foliicola]|nr:Vegetative incompatibility protein [Paramyrothecium foliicola]
MYKQRIATDKNARDNKQRPTGSVMAEPQAGGGRAAIPATGLSVLIDPSQARLDIVFVHGFKGHPERTWVQKTVHQQEPEQERPSKYQKLNFISRKAKANRESSVFWPLDLLPNVVSDARILTYGYDTKVQHRTGPPVSTHTAYDIAYDFLIALEAERRENADRPVLFIVHSLGGIVVKEMLRRASVCPPGQAHLGAILDATSGIMFFGTPHDGADPRGPLLKVAEKVYRAIGYTPNQQIVDTLLPSSERLRELRDAFGMLAEDKKWMIHSFQEQYAVKSIGCKVVEDNSSCLNMPNIEITEHIGRDHMGMSRFSGLEDPEFKKVAAALRRMVKPDPTSRTEESVAPTSDDIESLIASLRFDQLDARHESIKKAHMRTCKWLLHNSQYLDWLNPALLRVHRGFFWIKGKPGTGKSTIMKFVLGQSRNSMKGRDVLNFFFNARGEELERSTRGMYQSLLLQLLTRRPSLQSGIASFASCIGDSQRLQWNTESLKAAFEYAVQAPDSKPVTCFIDALDECDTLEIRDMVSFFQQLGETTISMNKKFTVCLSSRHYPHITIQHGIELVLDGHEGHTQDIADYVNSELKIGRSQLAEKIREELRVKAAGVFMWVVLVVDLLNKEHDRGRIHALRKRLQDLPDDLHKLFRDIILRDCDGKDELLLCIQWILFAKRPLKPAELYYALLSGIEPDALSPCDNQIISTMDMERFILDCSKGLAETTRAKNATVQFIHESVRDFLLKDNGLLQIWPDLQTGLTGISHMRLRDCCMAYIRFASDELLSFPETGLHISNVGSPKELHEIKRQARLQILAFIDYSVRNVLYHADKAAESKMCQEEFIESFPLNMWIAQQNIVEKHQIRKYDPRSRLLYILADNDWANLLLSLHFTVEDCIIRGPERYRCPLIAAWASGSDLASRALRKALISALPLSATSKQLLEKPMIEGIAKTNTKNKADCSDAPLSAPKVFAGADEGLKALYVCAESYVWRSMPKESSQRNLPTILAKNFRWAAANGSLALRLLSELMDQNYPDTNMEGIVGWIFDEAVRSGNTPAVAFLVGKDTHLNNLDYEKALSTAVKGGFADIAELLLQSGKVPASSHGVVSEQLLGALEEAFQGSHTGVLCSLRAFVPGNALRDDISELNDDLLARACVAAVFMDDDIMLDACIKTGRMDLKAIGSMNRPLLTRAVHLGHASIVERLMQAQDFDTEVMSWQSTLLLAEACKRGHDSVVKILLTHKSVASSLDLVDNARPLHHAAREGHVGVVGLLLQWGQVDPGFACRFEVGDTTPLHCAAKYCHEVVVKLLLETGRANVGALDSNGMSALDYAARRFPFGHEGIASILRAVKKDDTITE